MWVSHNYESYGMSLRLWVFIGIFIHINKNLKREITHISRLLTKARMWVGITTFEIIQCQAQQLSLKRAFPEDEEEDSYKPKAQVDSRKVHFDKA